MPESSLRGGPLPSRLSVSFFPDVFDQQPIAKTLKWATLVERLSQFPVCDKIMDKRQIPCWTPASFRGTSATAGDVDALSCLVLDLDNGTEVSTALDACAPFTVALHTSWSHRVEHPRFRLVLPLAQPIPASRWAEAWSLAVQVLDLPVDRACSNTNRRYLLPARPREDAPVFTEVRTTALALDLFPLLATPAQAVAMPRRPVVVPLHRVDRAVRRRMAQDPAARHRLADSLGATIRGTGRTERAEGVLCPGCGRASVWFLIAPEQATRARCNHKNSCCWTGAVTELVGWAA